MLNDQLTAPAWHAKSTKAALESFATTPNGLSKEEACNRLARHGPNRLPEAERRGPLVRFLYQFHNVLIYVLMAAGAITAMLGHWVDAGVIFLEGGWGEGKCVEAATVDLTG